MKWHMSATGELALNTDSPPPLVEAEGVEGMGWAGEEKQRVGHWG